MKTLNEIREEVQIERKVKEDAQRLKYELAQAKKKKWFEENKERIIAEVLDKVTGAVKNGLENYRSYTRIKVGDSCTSDWEEIARDVVERLKKNKYHSTIYRDSWQDRDLYSDEVTTKHVIGVEINLRGEIKDDV